MRDRSSVRRSCCGDAGSGICCCSAPRDAFTDADADVVHAFANQASLSLENAWLYERAREQATTDPLTGVFNHRTLKERLDEELTRAARGGRELCILVLDIDHFKAFKDAFDHAAGHAALRAVAGRTSRRAGVPWVVQLSCLWGAHDL